MLVVDRMHCIPDLNRVGVTSGIAHRDFFTEPIGDAYVALLESLGIAAVWKDEGGWAGSSSAASNGLLPPS